MKTKLFIGVLILFFSLGATSCVTYAKAKPKHHKEIPPGQMKKITGSKSARNYAPGHNK